MKILKKRKGFTMIETVAALAIVSGVTVMGVDYTLKAMENSRYEAHATLPLQLVKAIDRRVSIDGYSYAPWSTLPNSGNTEELLDYSKLAFISKSNLSCGQSSGWEPQLIESEREAIIPCSFGQEKYNLYDYKMITTSNSEGNLMLQNIIMRATSHSDLTDPQVFLQHKNVLNKLKANQPELKMGGFDAHFVNFNDLTNSLDVTECAALGNNCAIKVTWSSQGFNEELRITGTNSMIDSSISFAKDFNSDNLKCLIWEYDGNGSYSLNTSVPVNCGIGIYNKTMRPLLATVDVVSESLDVINPIILKQNCNTYRRDGSGFLIPNGQTECGLFTGDNGANQVIQVVESMQVDASSSSITDVMSVENLIVDELTTTNLEIANTLIVGGESSFNIIVGSAGSKVVLNDVAKMKVLHVLSPSIIEGNLTVLDNIDPVTSITKGLYVVGNVNLNNLTNSVQGNATVTGDADAGMLRLIQDTSISDGASCVYTDEGLAAFDGLNVLLCKETLVSGVFKWSSNRHGEILAFNGACPNGWTNFGEANGRTLSGNGKIFEPISGIKEYQTGQNGGRSFVKLTLNETPAHQHNIQDAYYSEIYGPLGKGTTIGSGKVDHDNNLLTVTGGSLTDMAGGDQAHENRMPYKVVNYCMYQEGNKASEVFADPISGDYWFPSPPLIGEWVNYGVGYNCTAKAYYDYRPSGPEYWSSTCDQNQERYITEKEINYITGVKRNTGIINRETQVIKTTETWLRDLPVTTPWVDISTAYNCSSTPTNVSGSGTSYVVTVTCDVDRERSTQEYISKQNPYQTETWGVPLIENATFQSSFNYTVLAPIKTCGAYNVAPNFDTYTTWTPNKSGYFVDESFTQTRTQNRTRVCTVRGQASNGIWYTLSTTNEYQSNNQSQVVNGTKARPVVVVDPFLNIKAGCWIDTTAFDTVQENSCAEYVYPNGSGNRVMKAFFSVGQIRNATNESFVLQNSSDYTVDFVSSVSCDSSSIDRCYISKRFYASETIVNMKIKVTHISTGAEKIFNVHALGQSGL